MDCIISSCDASKHASAASANSHKFRKQSAEDIAHASCINLQAFVIYSRKKRKKLLMLKYILHRRKDNKSIFSLLYKPVYVNYIYGVGWGNEKHTCILKIFCNHWVLCIQHFQWLIMAFFGGD